MSRRTPVVVIGAGQAGLAVSYYLCQLEIEHLLVERSQIAQSWRDRWDSFSLVTPNALTRIPGMRRLENPEGFLTRDQIVSHLEAFAESFAPPVQLGVEVRTATPSLLGFELDTSGGPIDCQHLVVATNMFQRGYTPSFANNISSHINQLHSSAYRNPSALPEGAVLVVGSGQSGAQIASELLESGREVFLSVSRAGRMPRRYRGKDVMLWLQKFGAFEQRVDQLDSPADRFLARPHVTGQHGGRTLDLRSFDASGMTLLGKVADASNRQLLIAGDLEANLALADDFASNLRGDIDEAIATLGVDAPATTDDKERMAMPSPLRSSKEERKLRLDECGITSIIWATGYRADFGWIDAQVFDSTGFPIHQRGITSKAGLYFASLPWLHTHKSSSLYGAAEDAAHIVEHIADALDDD